MMLALYVSQKNGKLDNLACTTYSVYNGGPSQLRRYRTKSAPKQYSGPHKLDSLLRYNDCQKGAKNEA